MDQFDLIIHRECPLRKVAQEPVEHATMITQEDSEGDRGI
jgi:hypothetical protein